MHRDLALKCGRKLLHKTLIFQRALHAVALVEVLFQITAQLWRQRIGVTEPPKRVHSVMELVDILVQSLYHSADCTNHVRPDKRADRHTEKRHDTLERIVRIRHIAIPHAGHGAERPINADHVQVKRVRFLQVAVAVICSVSKLLSITKLPI